MLWDDEGPRVPSLSEAAPDHALPIGLQKPRASQEDGHPPDKRTRGSRARALITSIGHAPLKAESATPGDGKSYKNHCKLAMTQAGAPAQAPASKGPE
jgi:hypothetical protein